MIYLTGDTHGKPARFSEASMPYASQWGKGDALIVCGDFGYVVNGSSSEELFLRKLSFLPFTICFVDGNRDNPELLKSYNKTIWHGGYVHRIRRNVIHLMRGQVYTFGEKTLFTMGGGYSVDKFRRYEGVDWWPGEMPSAEEYALARKNLKAAGMRVDYIVTHAAPGTVMDAHFDRLPEEKELNDFLDWVKQNVSYERWYFGHMHMDAPLDDDLYAMFVGVRELATGSLLW